jgi:hypothetical protein
MAVTTAAAGQAPPVPPPPNISFAHISVLMGAGTSVQRSEQPAHSTLGVALGADFFHHNVIGTGKLRGKFLTQEAVRDPDFVCAERDCGPAHRLGLRADAFVDLLRGGAVGLGVGAGVLAFGGTISTMVVEHPTFEKSLWSGHVGPSVSWRSDAAYAAISPVVDFKRETTLGGDSFTSVGGGITAAMGLIRSRFGVYANGRYLSHPQSSATESRFGELYPEAGIEARTVRVEGGVMADAELRFRYRVSAQSLINLGVYMELTRSDLRFLPVDQTLRREFVDRGISLSFEFLQN